MRFASFAVVALGFASSAMGYNRVDGLCGIKFGDSWETITNRIVVGTDHPDKPEYALGGIIGRSHGVTPRERAAKEMLNRCGFSVNLDRGFRLFKKEAWVCVTKSEGLIYRIDLSTTNLCSCSCADLSNEVAKVRSILAKKFGCEDDEVIVVRDKDIRTFKMKDRKLIGGRFFVTIYSLWTADEDLPVGASYCSRHIRIEVEDNETVIKTRERARCKQLPLNIPADKDADVL